MRRGSYAILFALLLANVSACAAPSGLSPAAGPPAPLPTAGLIAHWPLDGVGGNIVTDLVGAQDGALHGATWAAGGIKCDGQGGYAEMPSAGFAFGKRTAITVAAWVQSAVGNDGRTHDIVSQWNYPSSPGWVLTHHRNGQYFTEMAGVGYASGGSVSTGRTHVAMTYDGAILRLYVDGSEVAHTAASRSALPASSAKIRLCGQEDNSNWFEGVIDDVAIWDRALSAKEIAAIAGRN